MNLKISYKSIYYVCLFIWSLSYTLFSCTNIFQSIGVEFGYIYTFVWLGIRILLVGKIFLNYRKMSIYEFVMIVVILMVAEISRYSNSSDFLYVFMWFLAASKGIDSTQAIKQIFKAQTIVAVITIVLFLLGIVQNSTMIRTETNMIRNSFGYTHPNTFGVMILQICLLLLFQEVKNRSKYPYFIFGACFALTYWGANSRTSAYMIILTAIIYFIITVANAKSGVMRKVLNWFLNQARFIMSMILLMSILGAAGFINMAFGDSTLQARVTQMATYFKYYGISLFGQPLDIGYTQKRIHNQLYTLDNGYIYLLIGFGVVVFFLFTFLYFKTIKIALRRKNYITVSILVVYAILGFAETAMIRFEFNFALLFFIDVVWKKGSDAKGDINCV